MLVQTSLFLTVEFCEEMLCNLADHLEIWHVFINLTLSTWFGFALWLLVIVRSRKKLLNRLVLLSNFQMSENAINEDEVGVSMAVSAFKKLCLELSNHLKRLFPCHFYDAEEQRQQVATANNLAGYRSYGLDPLTIIHLHQRFDKE